MAEKRYRNEGYCVLPRRKTEIRLYADDVRRLFLPVEHNMLDVVRLIEHEMPKAYENFRYEVVPDEELGHFFMHRDQPMAFGRSAEKESIPLYMNSEWQADEFARNLLAPARLAKGMTTALIATMFEVSKEVARIVRREASAMFGEPIEPMVSSSPKSKTAVECLLPGLDWSAA